MRVVLVRGLGGSQVEGEVGRVHVDTGCWRGEAFIFSELELLVEVVLVVDVGVVLVVDVAGLGLVFGRHVRARWMVGGGTLRLTVFPSSRLSFSSGSVSASSSLPMWR